MVVIIIVIIGNNNNNNDDDDDDDDANNDNNNNVHQQNYFQRLLGVRNLFRQLLPKNLLPQEPISRSMQLRYISVKVFSLTDLFLDRISLE